LGIPFAASSDNDWIYAPYVEFIEDIDPPSNQDEWLGAVWRAQAVSNGHLWWNGIDTTKQKVNYAISQSLGGIMCYEVGGDSFTDKSLLTAIYSGVSGDFTYLGSGLTFIGTIVGDTITLIG
jgi:hypothetical protein